MEGTKSVEVFEEYFEEHEKFDSHWNLRDLLVQVSHFIDEKNWVTERNKLSFPRLNNQLI